MISIMMGPPGGGKTYETVIYHILPALAAGRKIITNIPLNVDALSAIDPGYRDLIEIRTHQIGQPRPFSQAKDFDNDWRNPKTNQGPLFIIDECQEAIPRGKTPIVLREFAAKHRHHGQDWLLLTQNYGKIDKDICDMTQLTYYVSKLTVLGRNDEYVKKVFSGLKRGSDKPVQQEVRKYDKKYFGYYQSHTASDKAVQEAVMGDINPLYKKVRRYGLILLALFVVAAPLGYFQMKKSFGGKKAEQAASKPASASQPPRVASGQVQTVNHVPVKIQTPRQLAEKVEDMLREPYDGMTLYIRGNIIGKDRQVWLFAVTRDGVDMLFQTGEELAKAGYKIRAVSDCLVILDHPALTEPKYVYCGSGMTRTPQSIPVVATRDAVSASGLQREASPAPAKTVQSGQGDVE